MVKLRLMRLGKKKRPFYRIVAADVNAPRGGGTLDQLGVYDPIQASVDIDEEAAVRWLNNGAQMTPTVKALLHSQGVLGKWKGFESPVRENALSKEKPKRRKKLAATAAEPETTTDDQQTDAPAVEAAAPADEASAADAVAEGTAADEEGGAEEEAAPEAADSEEAAEDGSDQDSESEDQ